MDMFGDHEDETTEVDDYEHEKNNHLRSIREEVVVPWSPCPLGCDDNIFNNNNNTVSASYSTTKNKKKNKLEKQCEEALRRFGEWKEEYIHRHYSSSFLMLEQQEEEEENILSSGTIKNNSKRPSSAPVRSRR